MAGSIIRKRIMAGLIGLAYAILYGFWTLLATGGGHGNFVWFMLMFFPGIAGLYYPLMAVLAVDLRSFNAKVVFGGLLALNVIVSLLMLLD
jgi:hypothetical protein